MKHGTQVEVRGWDMAGNETWERGTIRVRGIPKANRDVPGRHIVEYAADKARMSVAESRMRIVAEPRS